ncbi:MAG: Copper transport protein YcnJ [Anaerolineae bacterium]|nr:Copper transport protein YcnJ [Anaerolineae bacterium]
MIKLTLKKVCLLALFVLLITGINAPPAMAHASLIRSEPADSASLTDPPQEVRLWFNESISARFSSAQLLDVNAQPVEITHIQVDPTDPTLMILTLPRLSPGMYSIRWKVLSETDGHFTQGFVVFGVGADTDFSKVTPPRAEVALPWAEALIRWFNFGGLLALVGSVGVAYLVLGPGSSAAAAIANLHQSARQRVLVLALGCGGLALLVGFGLLLWQIGSLLETLPAGVSTWAVSWQLLSQTRWGFLWLARQGVLLAVLWLLHRQHRALAAGTLRFSPFALLLSLLLLALLAIQAFSGHAAALARHATLAVLTDVLHLLAASLWVGGLLALAVGLLPLILRRDDSVLLIRAGWGPFSRLAVLSVGLLLATGLYNTGRQVASIDALITNVYGQILLGKMGLMLLAGLFGLINSMLLHPGLIAPLARWLRRPPGWTPLPVTRFPALVLAEITVGLAAIFATGLITASPQARAPEYEVSPAEIPVIANQSVDDMLITFAAKPNRPGQNVFAVRAVSTRRPPPADVLRVILRFTFAGDDLGSTTAVDAIEIEPGLYQAGGRQLSLAGSWQVQVAVRRRGVEDSVAHFNWVVAPPGAARPVVISNRALEPVLTILAASLLLLLPLGSAGVWLFRRRVSDEFYGQEAAHSAGVERYAN